MRKLYDDCGRESGGGGDGEFKVPGKRGGGWRAALTKDWAVARYLRYRPRIWPLDGADMIVV